MKSVIKKCEVEENVSKSSKFGKNMYTKYERKKKLTKSKKRKNCKQK